MDEQALHLVCPECGTVNRMPGARLQEQPRCGHCHRPLFTGQPIELNAATLRQHMSRSDIPLMVDFWAPWCGPCRMMAPQFAQVAGQLEPHVRLGRLNVDTEPELSAQLQIRSIPMLALFKGGHEIARQAGAMTAPMIIDWVRTHG